MEAVGTEQEEENNILKLVSIFREVREDIPQQEHSENRHISRKPSPESGHEACYTAGEL